MMVNKVLIYRLGSLGDTIVALPAFHLIARAFPQAERRVLTNFPVSSKACLISAVLGESGLVHSYMSYPLGSRNPRQLFHLQIRMKQWKPDVLVYLAAPRGQLKAFRDELFLKLCGIRTVIGIPYTKSLQANKWVDEKQCYEHEAERLARCLGVLGSAKLSDFESWNLHLTVQEKDRARQCLNRLEGKRRFIACSIGTKVEVKDWGARNWRQLLRRLSHAYQGYGLVLIGTCDEFVRSESAIRDWSGPKLNLCGVLTPKESAAVLKHAVAFVGHDSGPMHLAACVGVPCVAIFSARNKPGVWFPYGNNHQVLYHKTDCSGCGLEVCERHKKKCIASITVKEVMNAVNRIMLQVYENTNHC